VKPFAVQTAWTQQKVLLDASTRAPTARRALPPRVAESSTHEPTEREASMHAATVQGAAT
jgi:hypothetical protein